MLRLEWTGAPSEDELDQIENAQAARYVASLRCRAKEFTGAAGLRQAALMRPRPVACLTDPSEVVDENSVEEPTDGRCG